MVSVHKLVRVMGLMVILAMASMTKPALASGDFLHVDEAFQLSYYLDEQEVVFDWVIAPHYYLYKDRFTYKADGASFGQPTFSDNLEEKYDPNFEETMLIFHDNMGVRLPVTSGDQFELKFAYQGCADEGLCYPPQKKTLTIDLSSGNAELVQVAAKSGGSGPQVIDLIGDDGGVELDLTGGSDNQFVNQGDDVAGIVAFVSALVLAFGGGLILNLMPCVFPVLSLKALHIAQFGGAEEENHSKAHGWVYTLGVVLSFLVVAGVLIILRQFGEWVGWGFQLQSPYFVAFLVYLFFFMSLTMAGLVTFGQSFMGLGQDLTQKEGLSGSFFTGVLATVVATPCTAPFMGSAIGFALAQPAYVSLLVFASMGFGLASPILLITYLPGLAKKLPKPGAWMEGFRQFMAFPLFATVVWLLWVLVEIKGTGTLFNVGMGLVLLAVACWPMLNKQYKESMVKRLSKYTVRFGALVVSLFLVFNLAEKEDPWKSFSPAVLNQALATGNPVFIDVTAAWCITCKANKRIALSGDDFFDLVDDQKVQLIQADWTNPSPDVDALIAQYGANGVPLYLYFPPGQSEAVVLPQVLTPAKIKETFTSI